MIIAAVPDGPVEVPRVVVDRAGFDTPIPVWRNLRGGLTFRLGSSSPGRTHPLGMNAPKPRPVGAYAPTRMPDRVDSAQKHAW
jgi:hypothetical protein